MKNSGLNDLNRHDNIQGRNHGKMLASVTSTASLASKIQKQHALYILSDFLASGTSAASMTSVASITFSASF